MEHLGLPVLEFATRADLRSWLQVNHASAAGVWVRLRRKGSPAPSVTFHEVLAEGLCFGWSENTRHPGDGDSYLQRFTPRRERGTQSPRNRALADRLVTAGLMTPAGLRALALSSATGRRPAESRRA